MFTLPFLCSENEARCNIPCLRPLRCAITLRSADVVLVLRSNSNVDAVTHQPTNTHSKASQHANKVALYIEWTHSRPDRGDSLFECLSQVHCEDDGVDISPRACHNAVSRKMNNFFFENLHIDSYHSKDIIVIVLLHSHWSSVRMMLSLLL